MGIQNEFSMFLEEKKNASMGESRTKKLVKHTDISACKVVNPRFSNGFHTIHMNLSNACRHAAVLDAWMEITIIVPMALHNSDFFQNRAIKVTSPLQM